MKHYSIDFDLVKDILDCSGVTSVEWRRSASGKGFHFSWWCSKSRCKLCAYIEKRMDDQKRYRHDKRRPPNHRRILWDSKGGKKAGVWHSITKESKWKPATK